MLSPIGLNKQGMIQLWLSFIVVGIGIWIMGDSTYYRGISGVVYGWIVLAALRCVYFDTLHKVIFISLAVLKVASDVMGWDLFGIPGQIGAKVSVAAHVFGLISVLLIIPFQYKSMNRNISNNKT
ncbi:hypothetical protein TYM08_P2184 [Marinicellulosiphila megalodicopiae]